MLYLQTLLIILIIYALIRLSRFKDYYSPTMLIIYGWSLSVFFCLLNYRKWGVDFKAITGLYIILAVLVFAIGEELVRHIRLRGIFEIVDHSDPQWINTMNVAFFLLLLIQLIGLVLLFREVISISGGITSSFAKMMFSFKNNQLTTNEDFSGIVNITTKVTSGISFVYLYIFLNNWYCKKRGIVDKRLGNWFNIIPASFGLVQSVLKGNRLLILSFPVFILVAYYLISNRYNYKETKIRIKTIIRVIIVFILVMVVFYNIRELVGRQSDSDFMTYISAYTGSSIVNFNNYLQDEPVSHWTKFYEFVPGLINSLYKIGLSPNTASKVLEFRTFTISGNVSNVYSGLRRMYSVWGGFGIIIFQLIYSLLFSGLYKDLKFNQNTNSLFGLKLIIYCKMVYCLALQSIEDQFFITDISIGYAIDILILICIYQFVMKTRSVGRK